MLDELLELVLDELLALVLDELLELDELLLLDELTLLEPALPLPLDDDELLEPPPRHSWLQLARRHWSSTVRAWLVLQEAGGIAPRQLPQTASLEQSSAREQQEVSRQVLQVELVDWSPQPAVLPLEELPVVVMPVPVDPLPVVRLGLPPVPLPDEPPTPRPVEPDAQAAASGTRRKSERG